MNEQASERATVLQMISEGQITVEEGARLLSSLSTGPARPQAVPQPEFKQPEAVVPGDPATGRARWFRVRVSDINSGKTKVMVNLPFAMVRWGLKIGAHYAEDMPDIDLEELANLLEQGFEGKIVDVLDEEDGEHVEIFVA
jgi:hypothetical protein